jgi:serine/threonine protein kinase
MGKLHRDIKPSNVLVAEDGRVVLLDFGLVEDINPELHETLLAGTPDYMSPEQGAQTEIMTHKQTREPIQAREINPDIPRDLNDLCTKLLRRKPETRPSGREILRVLGVRNSSQLVPLNLSSTAEGSFVGRERQLAELDDAFRATRAGQTVTVYVHGNSGLGKSTPAAPSSIRSRRKHITLSFARTVLRARICS